MSHSRTASLRRAALWLLLLLPLARAATPDRPNIVFVLVDDLGWRDGQCFGSTYYRTPHLDRLAADGLRFTSAYAACAVCSPTRAALMTGLAPARLHLTDWIPGEGTPARSRFRVPDWRQELPAGIPTLAEALRTLGYATASIGKWHLGGTNATPLQRGFDLNIGGAHIGQPASYFWPYGATNATHRVPGLAETGGQTGEYLTDRLTDEALRFIESNRQRPFFLYLAHYAVHSPLMGKEELAEGYRARSGSQGQSNAVYAAMIQSVDDSVGRIRRQLADLGLDERTILVYTSDNGGAVHFGQPRVTSNAPLRLGKGYPYEGGLRVPLLVRVPGVTPSGRVCDTPIITQDWFPTLLELAHAPASLRASARDGVSLVPLLRGGSRLPRQDFFWHYPHYWFGTNVTPYSVARVGDWKLIRFYESGREELYNLRRDLGETHDLAAAEPARLRKLSRRLDEWLREVDAQSPVPR